jgi:hypothetical protein
LRSELISTSAIPVPSHPQVPPSQTASSPLRAAVRLTPSSEKGLQATIDRAAIKAKTRGSINFLCCLLSHPSREEPTLSERSMGCSVLLPTASPFRGSSTGSLDRPWSPLASACARTSQCANVDAWVFRYVVASETAMVPGKGRSPSVVTRRSAARSDFLDSIEGAASRPDNGRDLLSRGSRRARNFRSLRSLRGQDDDFQEHAALDGVTLSPAVGAVLMSLSTIIVAANAQLLVGWISAPGDRGKRRLESGGDDCATDSNRYRNGRPVSLDRGARH